MATTLLMLLSVPADPAGTWAAENGWVVQVTPHGKEWRAEWWSATGTSLGKCVWRRSGPREFIEKQEGCRNESRYTMEIDGTLVYDAGRVPWSPLYRPRKR